MKRLLTCRPVCFGLCGLGFLVVGGVLLGSQCIGYAAPQSIAYSYDDAGRLVTVTYGNWETTRTSTLTATA